ncbi:MAG: hypothetical protein L3J08_04175 [Flavobacteriaceae bacterium]|nr:hypothetical protein [Flavobacteriaceae bacterium]
MKNLILIGMLFSLLSTISCTPPNDLKQISGSLIFSEIGTHNFSINAENIEATVTMVGPNNGEIQIFKNIELSSSTNYTAKIEEDMTSKLLNNLVLMYEAKSGGASNNFEGTVSGAYIKIDWRGFD